ncbi:mitochondrial endopeptidase [Hygrophoropsis aurantiaca]|uniref:Mitochondrial endopeptidase n=1 Tax=Hygrophoropsis aurantiaca TaxID=72124 RepID=A0ACB8AJ16_9AGAM|nr:mitochondrial endopeptidase [Hygrophoropsis aurantiaca]
MVSLTPPQAAPNWNHTPEQVLQLVKAAIEEHKAVSDKIGTLSESECNFESVFHALAGADTILAIQTEPLAFYRNVATDKALRDASTEVETLKGHYHVDLTMRLDVFQAKVVAEKNLRASGEWDKLNSEQQRLAEKMVLESKRAGLALPEKEREQLTLLKKDLSQVCLEFLKNFNEEDGRISFTLEELDGVPADVISGFTKRSEESRDIYDVTFKAHDIFKITAFATNPMTRQRAQEGRDGCLAVNVPVLERALDLRRQMASILGYQSWADYVAEDQMVKTGANALRFLDDLEAKMRPLGEQEQEALLALKKEEHKNRGFPFDGEFYTWDNSYYERIYKAKTLSLDSTLVKEHFPVSFIVPTVLTIYQNLLGVRFVEIKDNDIWHPDVQKFAVWEADAKDESGFVGYCYLDLYPRTAKYPHASVWCLLPGYQTLAGGRHYPTAAMVADLGKPTPDYPALMTHFDVTMFFHEMGHIFHELLSRTQYARFHGTTVSREFMEAPSQMLENWCWEPKVLEKMSSHYKTQQPLSAELIDKIIKSRYVNIGLFNLFQIFFAKFDLKVHLGKDAVDYTKLWNDMKESTGLRKSTKALPGQGAFKHLATNDYSAGYYVYRYSLVFAADMYATVFKQDPLDPAMGKWYRDKVLLVGGSRDDLDTLEDFLGRPPNSNAFLKEMLGTIPTL